jgi:LSD1 subclass zinc finger protein
MNWFRKLMAGRYGGDQLSMALIIVSLLFTLAAGLAGLPLLAYIGYVPLGVGVFRMLSKNIAKRRMENYKFAILMSPAYSWLMKTRNRLADAKIHRYFICPSCRTRLRLPKGKGKIIITCPKCKTAFAGKT